ncbi:MULTISPECIES: SRPBCC family protein [Brevundimonas]|uniref:SRPBCC family protein n=1 Tax=Brevundimonas sp. TaxID=1871086 RepID=UPI0025BB37CB|nr:hypothetical protein [Brevundimonas sp.]MCG2664216.1 hypothetical protein [Brevundimonas sp.]
MTGFRQIAHTPDRMQDEHFQLARDGDFWAVALEFCDRLTGRMLDRRKPNLIAWRLGMRGFVFLSMSYTLTPRGNGTHVSFSAEVSGFVPRIFPNHFPNLLPAPMAGTLRALKRRAEMRGSRPASVPGKKPRHGGPHPADA